jgi:S-(hydroxymethyl)glutathione dehydrogenase/alcohol dehydrogenase
VVEVELAGPRAGEVLAEIKATGISHTDAYTLSAADPEGLFPVILRAARSCGSSSTGTRAKSLRAVVEF